MAALIGSVSLPAPASSSAWSAPSTPAFAFGFAAPVGLPSGPVAVPAPAAFSASVAPTLSPASAVGIVVGLPSGPVVPAAAV